MCQHHMITPPYHILWLKIQFHYESILMVKLWCEADYIIGSTSKWNLLVYILFSYYLSLLILWSLVL